jgi:hypothetical protein
VKEEIALTQAQTDAQEQQLQAVERKKASSSRLTSQKFFSRTDLKLDEIREQQVQRNARRTRQYF